jgi:hypothetical protein
MTDDAHTDHAHTDAAVTDAAATDDVARYRVLTDDAAYDAVTRDRAVYDVGAGEAVTDGAGGQDLSATDGLGDLEAPRDWAWVEEWREGHEPVPWGPGLALSGFTLILVASAVYVLSSGLFDRPIVMIAVNLLVAAGLGPALWLSRGLPVLRWIAGGAVAGVLTAWLCVLVFLV